MQVRLVWFGLDLAYAQEGDVCGSRCKHLHTLSLGGLKYYHYIIYIMMIFLSLFHDYGNIKILIYDILIIIIYETNIEWYNIT